jgi:nitrite reductase/ring-hydroxylating ferredoxin subunit
MTHRALLADLPRFPVCTVRELLAGVDTAQSKAHAEHKSRRVVALPNGREIAVVVHPATLELFAIDRFCYHAGYPLEPGDIEDICALEVDEPPAVAGAESTAAQSSTGAFPEGLISRVAATSQRRSTGRLRFRMEEHLRAAARALGAEPPAATPDGASERGGGGASDNSSAAAEAAALAALAARVRPGKLEADFDDDYLRRSRDETQFVFPVITCALHNRLFDLRTGDMITRGVVTRSFAGDGGAAERRCLTAESTGCHQRVHPVSIDRSHSGGEGGDPGDAIIFVHDTFGFSTAVRRPGAALDMVGRTHLMFFAMKKVLSDKENAVVAAPSAAVAN